MYLGRFKLFMSFDSWKVLEVDHFQAIYEIELNSHTKSNKSHLKLGPAVYTKVGKVN